MMISQTYVCIDAKNIANNRSKPRKSENFVADLCTKRPSLKVTYRRAKQYSNVSGVT